MKRIFVLLLTLSVLLSVPLTAQAHDVPQERNDCSIELIVRYDGENVDGGTLTAIKVGYVDEEDGNYFFSQEFTNARIEDITSPGAAKTQRDFYRDQKGNYDFYTQTVSVKDGKTSFSGLTTGLYLIVQNEAAAGFSKIGAFLISVPRMEDGAYQYHVTAAVKSEIEREPEPTVPEPTVPEPSGPPDPWLPQTGQLNWPVPMLAAVGLTLFVIGWVLCFGKKRKQHEQ